MNKIIALFMLFILMVFSGCRSSTNDKTDDTIDDGNGNNGIHKVSGYVKLTSEGGAGIKGVSVRLTQSGPNVYIMSTNSDGYYEFDNVTAGKYSVTFSMTGYAFDPPGFSNLSISDKDITIQTSVGIPTGGNP
jgi:hypothetical protein